MSCFFVFGFGPSSLVLVSEAAFVRHRECGLFGWRASQIYWAPPELRPLHISRSTAVCSI
jgi:hypothetical protein